MRYFIHCDNSFRNHLQIASKLNFLDAGITEEESQNLNTITFLYGYTYSTINRAFSKMNVRLNRRTPDEISKCLTYTDCVILFHNFIEYNNGMQSIIDTCLENNISLIVFSDHIKKKFLSNHTGDLTITHTFPKITENNKIIKLNNFNFNPYKFVSNLSYDQVLDLTRKNYLEINEAKTERQIKCHSLSLKKA